MDHPFRSAAFGGFNRQDVLTYLEKTAQEAAQRQEELQKRLEEAQTSSGRQTTQLDEQKERLDQLTQENEDLQTRLEETETTLTECQAEREKLTQELAAARKEAEEWKDKAAAPVLDALAYTAVKERAAGVELDAHRRAQTVLDQANDQARQLRRQVDQWRQTVEREYDALRSQVEATVSHAADQLAKAGRDLEQVTALMEEQELVLDSLSREYADTDTEKVKAPLPIPEN